jgi:hypothetical protein
MMQQRLHDLRERLEEIRVAEVFSISRIERHAATSTTRQSLLSQLSFSLALLEIPENPLKDVHIRTRTSETDLLFLRQKL